MRIVSQQLLTLLFNSLWQIALIAATATLCARLLRPAKAGTRHRTNRADATNLGRARVQERADPPGRVASEGFARPRGQGHAGWCE